MSGETQSLSGMNAFYLTLVLHNIQAIWTFSLVKAWEQFDSERPSYYSI